MQASQRLANSRSCGQASTFAGTNVKARAVSFKPFSRNVTVAYAKSSLSNPVALPVIAADGNAQGTTQLQIKVAPSDSAKGLVHRYLVYVQQNARRGTASTLTRTEVRGGGRKPYRQKGTGNARRGSSTSPLFPGGGVSFGPKPKDWSIDMNKKERRLALSTALGSAAGDMVVVDGLKDFSEPKTKALLSVLNNVGVDPMEEKVLIITNEVNNNIVLAGRNVEKLAMNSASAIRVFDVLNADRVVIEREALDTINTLYS